MTPDRFVSGFNVTGVIEASNIFPRTIKGERITERELGGATADAWNNAMSCVLLAARTEDAAKFDAIGYELTIKEISEGVPSPLASKRSIDSIFGVGCSRNRRRRIAIKRHKTSTGLSTMRELTWPTP